MQARQSDIKMKILMAAKKLFAKQGFDATTVRQICEEAGANVALVSYYFGGKENVYYAIFDIFFPGYKLAEFKEELQHPVEGLKLLIREVIRFRMEDPEMGIIIQQEFFTESPRINRIMQHITPFWETLRSLLENGRSQGLFHFRSVSFTLLMVLGNLLFPNSSKVHLQITGDEQQLLEERVDETIRFVFGGLGYNLEKGADSE